MDLDLIVSNILNPPILFFFLGMLAVLIKSDLEIPPPIPKLFSLYLLLAIGFKGGVELVKSGINQEVILTMAAAILHFLFSRSNLILTMRRRSRQPMARSVPLPLLRQVHFWGN